MKVSTNNITIMLKREVKLVESINQYYHTGLDLWGVRGGEPPLDKKATPYEI